MRREARARTQRIIQRAILRGLPAYPLPYPGITGLGTLGQRGYVIAAWALAKTTGLQSAVTWFLTYRVYEKSNIQHCKLDVVHF